MSVRSSFYTRCGKRLLDFVLACGLLAVCAPPMTLIAVAVAAFSGAPLLFRQTRIGLRGTRFTIYKFRTMRVRAIEDGSVTIAGDSRVTAVGRFLRRYKLDELPQLWNVLRGDMSFVGPRPEVPEYADTLSGTEREILEIRPGITGPATLVYRDEEALLARQSDPERYSRMAIYPHKIALNSQYIRQIGLLSDLGWIVETIYRRVRTDALCTDALPHGRGAGVDT